MIKEILTTYWSQAVLLILGIAYFVKRIFDIKSKKIEIKYSLFQQNRIDAVNTFFSNYAKVEFMWHKLPYYDILEHKISAEQIDEMIWPPLYALKQSTIELKVYFPANDLEHFEKLYEQFLSLNQMLLYAVNDFGNSENIVQKSNAFTSKRDKTFRENNLLIEGLTSTIRTSFSK